jgi:3,4-dihydroxy 2-butanone 4-phosphate synthase/GTP cyclohydrolase II
MNMLSNLEQALADFKSGKIIIVTDAENRENEADLVFAGGSATQEKLAFMIRYTSGIICVAITADRAKKLHLPQMVTDNQDDKKTAFTVSVDYKVGITTGISAQERANTILALANDQTKSSDLLRPGHIFPLVASTDLLKSRQGHTEAAVELCLLTDQKPVGVIAELVNDDGTMMRAATLEQFAQKHKLPIISIKELASLTALNSLPHKSEREIYEWSQLPRLNSSWQITTDFGSNGATHAVLAYGDIKKSELLTRVHSECLTGDIFNSARCDCGEQLNLAMAQIEKEGAGLIIYMRGHEGRGIGLSEKIKAYKLQDEGMDTAQANIALGHEIDKRNWHDAVLILQNLGISSVRLLTNNPAKIKALESASITVERMPIIIKKTSTNEKYLNTKRALLNHEMGEI